MPNLPIAVIGDSVSPHNAKDNPSYPVGATKIIGTSGSPSVGGTGGTSSGSVDVFADGLSVHRQYDITGQQHISNAILATDGFVGPVPVETIPSLGFFSVYNFHMLGSYLTEGSPSVFVNGLPAGFQGATYVCSASVDGRSGATVRVPNNT
tara:strand:- start:36 stop:488 length:453 start_codon:yes stop_codon:yes gene_type:complete